MHGDLETLYDAHAHRLYAHCWSLLGDQGAADALRVTLAEAVRYPARGETVLWLHHLTRTVCSERGAFSRHGRPVFAQADADPLLKAVGELSAGHREALLLSAGKWLEFRDIASVLRVSLGTVRELVHEARTALERLVLDALIRGVADPAKHMDVIAAFEKGRLPHLLARRAPTWAPAPLRDQVLTTADPERDEFGRAPAAPAGQLVVIGSEAGTTERRRGGAHRRKAALKAVGGATGVAATVAAGLLMTWPSGGGGAANALGPHDNTRPGPVPAGGVTDEPSKSPGAGKQDPAPTATPTTAKRSPVTEEPTGPDGGSNRPAKPSEPERDTPSAPPATPPTSRQQTPPPPPQKSPEQPPDDDSGSDNPLKPITDIVGGVTSPIVGGLTGR
ncbi:RNA polymerase sigma factor [Spirillospora sp. CA-142024]|uniref:RNA polymerase sigma factor n=1 Tax=Spirillospora sp. CA-142024 TaxID=3240036 RepID=UPI003D8BED3C